MSKAKDPIRRVRARQDIGAQESIRYNDATGADKVIIVEPAIARPVAAAEPIGSGKYVKVTGASYTLDALGKAYVPANTYQIGDVVENGGFIYIADKDDITGAFDATQWRKVAPKTVGPIAITAGSVVTTGRWHNTVTVAGFLVDDESDIRHFRVRD